MDHSTPLSTAPSTSVGELAALTQPSDRDGAPYVRPADIESEILAVLASDPRSWSPASLKSETLVYLTRWLWHRNDQKTLGSVIGCLGKRIAHIARDFVSGFKPYVAEEFAVEIAEEVNLLIFIDLPTRQSEFLEVSFREAIKRRAINKRAKLKGRLKHEVAESSIRTVDTGEGGDGIVASHADGAPGPVDLVLADEAKRLQPERIRSALAAISNSLHREAVVLHHLQGWQIFSTDSAIPTLSTHFKKSPRQIQNWLGVAMNEMRTALGDSI